MDRTNDAPRRRRVARMTRLALLERREALLHDFLVRANTESPAFRDDLLHETGIGLRIGPAVVTQDFVGSPIIRVRVTNSAAASTNALVEVQIANKQGKVTRASIAVSLQPGESRILELLCPQKIDPASLNWTVTAL